MTSQKEMRSPTAESQGLRSVSETTKVLHLLAQSFRDLFRIVRENRDMLRRPKFLTNAEYLPHRLESTFWLSVDEVVKRKLVESPHRADGYIFSVLLANNKQKINALLRRCYLPECYEFFESVFSDYPAFVADVWSCFEEKIHQHNGVSLQDVVVTAIERNFKPEDSSVLVAYVQMFGTLDDFCTVSHTQENGIDVSQQDMQFIVTLIENQLHQKYRFEVEKDEELKKLSEQEKIDVVRTQVKQKMLFIIRDIKKYLKMADDRVLVERHMERAFHIQEQLGQFMIEILTIYYEVLQKLLLFSGSDFVEFISSLDAAASVAEKKLNIAMDSGTCAGSGTTAKNLVENFGYKEVGMGAIFRALTLFALEKGWKAEELSAAIASGDLTIEIFFDTDKKQGTIITYKKETHRYTSSIIDAETQANAEVKQLIPFIASDEAIVLHLNSLINTFLQENEGVGVVIEGRDREKYVETADIYVYLYLSHAAIRDRTTRRSEKTSGEPMSQEKAEREADADVQRYRADIQKGILANPTDVVAGKHRYDIAIDTTHYSPKLVFGYILMEMLNKLTEQSMKSESVHLAAMKDASYVMLRMLINMVRSKSIRYANSTVVISRVQL